MSTTTAEPQTSNTDTGNDDAELNHLYCCDEDTALCGLDISGMPEAEVIEGDPDICLVCDDLARQPCDKCGDGA